MQLPPWASNHKWSCIRIRFSGFIRIEVSTGSLPKCSGSIPSLASVISQCFVKKTAVSVFHLDYSDWKFTTDFHWSTPLTSTWPHLRCDVCLEEGEYRENCLSCSSVYCYNGAQRYEQFLQVGQLYRALILLSLALFRAPLSLRS